MQTTPTAPTAADDLAQSFANHRGYLAGAQKHLFYVRMCANGTLYYANRPNITAADVAAADNAAERAVHHAEFACQFVALHQATIDAAAAAINATDAIDGDDVAAANEVITNGLRDAAAAADVITNAIEQANIAKERAFIARQRANAINPIDAIIVQV
jgi:hypothetical protein